MGGDNFIAHLYINIIYYYIILYIYINNIIYIKILLYITKVDYIFYFIEFFLQRYIFQF